MPPILTTTFDLIIKPSLGALIVELAGSSQQKQHVVSVAAKQQQYVYATKS